jgi:hypothetical protein
MQLVTRYTLQRIAGTSSNNSGRFTRLAFLLLSILTVCSLSSVAQTGGQGALQGTVTDATGAVVPNASVTATNQATGIVTSRTSSGAGLYNISPLIPGIYTVTVKAEGFSILSQKNIEVNGLNVTGFNASLNIGATDQTVTISSAPPQLQTTSATLGAVITNETYASLPVVMNGQQRDPSSFATLAPGAQGGARAPIFSGTGNYLAEVYIDGIPTTTANQQGDNRVVSNGVPVESVDQLQIISSGPSAEYQGAGAIGFTIKSGTAKYHGQVIDLIRNTVFDTYGFAGNQQTKTVAVNGVLTTVPAGKPIEHQNELSASVGGPIPFTHTKGFFFVNYDKYHGRSGVNPTTFTVPTALMKQGDFTELGAGTYIYNPLTNNCVGTTCTRQPFRGLKNGVPTNNVIPASYLSPISQYEQKFMPDPNLPGLVNNYIQGGVSGFDNHVLLFKVDYDLPKEQRISFVFLHGVRQSIGYGAALPLPYTSGAMSSITPTMLILEHSIPITSRMVNQFKYGFTRFPQPVVAPTDGVPGYGATDAGITGLPPGQASGNFPGTSFGTTTSFATAPTIWTQGGATDATHNVVPNAYTLVDNFQWSKGQHNLTFGIQMQWLQDNTSSQSSPSGIYTQAFAGISTSQYVGTALNSANTGYSYASFLLGAVNNGATSVPLFTETAGRYRPISPYFQDDWKVRPNLTLNIGLRWDYLPPYHEDQDRWSFFNPNATNPLTGNPGTLQFAGNRGSDISCQCRTPVQTYWKNWGPRLGAEWAPDPKTVFRAGFAIAYSRAGGVGGRAGDSTGTGQAGFGSNIVLPAASNSGVNAGPSYYLNNGEAFTAAGRANTNFGGPGYVIPPATQPSAASLTLNTGNYVNSNGAFVTPGSAPAYADPYLSGRAPEFIFFNAAMQKVLTKNTTITVTYSGSQSHFVGGAGVSGYWSGQIDPKYLATLGTVYAADGKTNVLNAQATPANIAIAQRADPSIQVPYGGYAAAGAVSPTVTIGRMLRPTPQYSTPSAPTWDNVANLSYNALQISLAQREYKGVSFTVNYTYSRNIGDDGTTRSAFAVPAAASSSGLPIAGNNRADRDLVLTDTPENLNAYGLAKSPFGKGKLGGDHWAVRNIAGGWQLAGIFAYTSGTPILVTGGSSCTSPSQGTCMPDLVPGRAHSIRINGGYGAQGITYANYTKTPLLDATAFTAPQKFIPSDPTSLTKIGDAPRSSLNIRQPSRYNLDAAVQRSFNVTPERVKFIFRADCFDVTNKVTFSMPQAQVWAAGTSSFGQLTSFSGNRRFQFSGRISF